MKANPSFYEKLELNPNASTEEVKKRYRDLAKKYHPDNKNTGNEEKFKSITEAYENIINPKPDNSSFQGDSFNNPFHGNPFGGIHFSGFPFQQQVREVSNIDIGLQIPFIDSVLGTKKDISFNRKAKCNSCKGEGAKTINNGCTDCGGKGQTVRKHGNAVMIITCPKCHGVNTKGECSECSGEGTLDSEISLNVTIPPGIKNGNVLRLNNAGNFMGNFGPFEQYTNVDLHISVESHPNFTLVENDVVSNLTISLREALAGCNKTVKTISGEKEITTPKRSRHKDEIIIKGAGVPNSGNQRVILDVEYPNDLLEI